MALALHPHLVRDDGPIERAADLGVPASLRDLLVRAHGPDGLAAFEVPHDYAAFVREHGGGLRTVDRDGRPRPHGWSVLRWSHALAATEGGYRLFLGDAAREAGATDDDVDVDEIAAARAGLVEAGVWLLVGRAGDRHDHFLSCDRRRATFGSVLDLNDGHPALGLVADARWPSFTAYVGPRA